MRLHLYIVNDIRKLLLFLFKRGQIFMYQWSELDLDQNKGVFRRSLHKCLKRISI